MEQRSVEQAARRLLSVADGVYTPADISLACIDLRLALDERKVVGQGWAVVGKDGRIKWFQSASCIVKKTKTEATRVCFKGCDESVVPVEIVTRSAK